MKQHVILFLAANPDTTNQLRLGEECAAIQRELTMVPHRDDFRFESRFAVSIDELIRHLNELSPTVIHFSGHGGGKSGLLFQDEQRRPQPVSARALAMIVDAAAQGARLVVLNACYTTEQAEVLRARVECVVGMDGAIGDNAALAFAIRFYGALGNRRSIGNALDQGVAALAAKKMPDELLPLCLTRDGVDEHRLFLSLPSSGPTTTEPLAAASTLPATSAPRGDAGGTSVVTPQSTNSRAVRSIGVAIPLVLAITALLWMLWPSGTRRTELGNGAYLLDEPFGQAHRSIAYVAPTDARPSFADLGWAQSDMSRVAREWRFVAGLAVATFAKDPPTGPYQDCRLFARGTGVGCEQRVPLQVIISSGVVLRAQPAKRLTSAISAICVDNAQMWRLVLVIPKDASKPSDLQTSLFYEHLLQDQKCLDAAEVQTGEPVQLVVKGEKASYFTIPGGASQGFGRNLVFGLR